MKNRKKELKNLERIEVILYSKDGICHTLGFKAPVKLLFEDKTKTRAIQHKGKLGGRFYSVSSRVDLTYNILGDSAKEYVITTRTENCCGNTQKKMVVKKNDFL